MIRLWAVKLAAALVFAAGSSFAVAQNYPTKPVRMILPFPPGGPTDLVGRLLAQKLGEQMGQTVPTDNRPGASGNIGLELAAKAPQDGYTIVLSYVGTFAKTSLLPIPGQPPRPDCLLGRITARLDLYSVR